MQEAGHIELVASRARGARMEGQDFYVSDDRTALAWRVVGSSKCPLWAAASVDGNGVAAPKLCGQCSTLVSQSWVLASREVREVTQSAARLLPTLLLCV